MKISFEKKIFLGFIVNILVVAGWIFITRLNEERDTTMDNTLDWIEISLLLFL
jgi:uncharacterized protein involved in cysteine biosynthesis